MAAPRKDDIKKLIVSTCEQLLENKSFRDISLSEIGNVAQISKGTIYYHFKTKEDMMFAVMDSYLDRQYQELQVWLQDKNKDTSLPRLAKYVLERNVHGAQMRFYFLYEAISGNVTIKNKLIDRYNKFKSLIASYLDIDDKDALAWSLLFLSDGLLIQMMLENNDVNDIKYIEDIAREIKKIKV
ncbi:MAG: TetR/AcrR family transcriptional regulator [Erysipelotrichaceae bacterium]